MIYTPVDGPRPDNRSAPIILKQYINDTEVRYTLQVPCNLVYFENHFPDHPVLPGVVQIKWVLDLAGRLPLPKSFQENFSTMTKIKFMRLITPGIQLTLQLMASPSNKSLSFRYFDNEGDYSSGHLGFK